jgi:hypothetical protein
MPVNGRSPDTGRSGDIGEGRGRYTLFVMQQLGRPDDALARLVLRRCPLPHLIVASRHSESQLTKSKFHEI